MLKSQRSNRKEKTGVVVSDKMDKTIIVSVQRVYHHPIYNKRIRSGTKFVAHDEKEDAGIGDTVRIIETRPLSKTKRWRLVEVIKKINLSTGDAAGEPEKATEK